MKGLTYFAAAAVFAAAMIFAQSSTSGSGNPPQQAQTNSSSSPADHSRVTQHSGAYDAQTVPHSSVDTGIATPSPTTNTAPAARAVATHTPDPGTCMNPAAFDNGQTASGEAVVPRTGPGCQ